MLTDYLTWLRTQAIPVWEERGFDRTAGRFHERLDRDAQPLPVPHRAMVQARQIYVFAHAALLGWHPGADELASRALASLKRDYLEEDGAEASFAFSIDPASGALLDQRRDAYTHAFILFALAWGYRLTRDPEIASLAEKVWRFVERRLVDPVHAGLHETWPRGEPGKRQNPLMHLLEACLFLARALPGRGWEERAAALVALFRERLFMAQPGLLLEHFAEDWSEHPDEARRGIWEPGHHMEWVWLLAEAATLAGIAPDPAADALFRTAMMHGRSNDGCLFDEVDAALIPRKRSHRLWPHTEAMKAGVARMRLGDQSGHGLAEEMAAILLRSFCSRPFAGGWIDQIDADGAALVEYVPASSLYHLFLAGAVAAEI